MDLRIDHPLWLLLFIPTLLYFGWAWIQSGKRYKREHKIIFYMRVLAISLLVFALSAPYILLPIKEEQVVFLVDRSASMKGTKKEIASWIQESMESSKDYQIKGVYSFADGFQTDLSLSSKKTNLPEWPALKNIGQTNLANALQLASNVVDSKKATRIVVFSDGVETAGSATDQLSQLQNSNIQIDTVKIDKPVKQDVAITSFDTPPVAYKGEQQQLTVQIESSTNTTGELSLSANDQVIEKQKVQLDSGSNTVTFRHKPKGDGLFKYKAQLKMAEDALLENNELTSVTTVQGTPRILLVHGDDVKASSLANVIDQNTLVVEDISAMELPSMQSSYIGYDAIIFDNVSGHLVGEEKMSMIEQAVKNFGMGFMMIGGENSFGLGGYFKTPIETILPVEMEVKGKEQLPSLGLTIVLDKSGSMDGNKIKLAKEAAVRSVELLRDDDTFGFIAFDDRPWEIIPPAPLTDKEQAIEKILSVPPNGGTEIYSSLSFAYESLRDLKLQRKHIILLTDGEAATSSSYDQLIEEGKNANITLSTVAIGQDSDRSLLQYLAEVGAGRFYDVADEETIPSILSRETSMLTRTYIEDNPFYPIIDGGAKWQSLFTEGVPKMNAYIATTAKQTANVIVESEKDDPVLAEWKYGLGKTMAFTSDTKGKWTGDWARWQEWSNFWNTTVSELLPSYNEVPYNIQQQDDGSFIVSDPTAKSAFMDIVVVDEKGGELPITEEPLAPGKTRVNFEHGPGLVYFRVSNDDEGMYQAGLTIPYSSEYRMQQDNTKLLTELSTSTNGKELTDPAEAFRKLPTSSAEQQNIAKWLILAAMLLFFIDITLRRFGWTTLRNIPKGLRRKKDVTDQEEQLNVGELLKNRKKR
ncbi:VWA domain-containing protein [Viridibacillus sp. YIM B01967]|uniref:VWA domain-containing protein n=1 Tax=Viridibacillus soli TaxID=2798301 RepID=A0ABS1H7I0_9BACL|nr:VWA domain-containing protein [Viridibacillus soli]MBK3495382.1 VWA domain-containing protein [Viridibacillus soli]